MPLYGTAEWLNKPKPRVCFGILTADNRYASQIVSILGRVNSHSVDPTGLKITAETSDRQQVVIRMREPLSGPLPTFVEFICRVGKSVRELECLYYSPINAEITGNFDFDQYNKAIEIGQKYLTTDSTNQY